MAEDPGRYQAQCTQCRSTVGARLAPHPRAQFIVNTGGELSMRLHVPIGCTECGHTDVEIPVRRRRAR